MFKAIGNLLVGIGVGAFAAVLLALVFFILMNAAIADETIAVREARLGEQNRSLNYPLDPYVDTGSSYDPVADDVLSEVLIMEAYLTCLKNNKRIAYQREYILKQMELIPSVAYIYEDALATLVLRHCEAPK